jgi:hypothetical protein
MTTRLIDPVAYRRELEREKKCERTGDVLMGLEIAIADLGDMPTIDAEPVKHGRWIDIDGEVYECDMCHGIRTEYKYNYCHDCGARMDGDSNG